MLSYLSVPSCPLWLIQFSKHPRRSHSPADAHGHDSIPAVAALQFTQYRRRELGSGASQRMPQGHRSAVGIDLVRIKPAFLDHGERLRRESFIQLDYVNVFQL